MMLRIEDITYFADRERIERAAAETAKSLAAKRAHELLADHYADRVWALRRQERSGQDNQRALFR